jgi:hypothetical protein
MADRKEPSPTRKDFVPLENVTFEPRERFQREMGDIRARLEDQQEAGQPMDEVEPLRQAAAAMLDAAIAARFCRRLLLSCGGGSGVKSGFVFSILLPISVVVRHSADTK